ncbi:MAG: TolC family protein [Phycisphaerales bacterium]|nr:MAG: TolC family protein [Phycisphaerales bacterium]
MRLKLLLLVLLSLQALSGCVERGGTPSMPEMRVLPRVGLDQPSPRAETSAATEFVEPTGVITLDQALALALEHSPELKAFSLDVSAAEARRVQAGLGPNPTLAVQSEEAVGEGDRSGFDGAESSLKISQRIEMGQKRDKRSTLASMEKELAKWDYKAKRLDVKKQVTEAFIALLKWQKKLALAQEVVRIAEQAHNAVAQRVEAGRDSPIEKTKSSVALATARIEPQRARLALESAKKRLAATWGSKVARFDSVVGEFDNTAPVPSSAELGGLVRQNPDVARWDAEMQKSRAALELEKSRAVSDITLSGGWQYFNETDDSAAVFGLSIPLAVSDRNQGGIRRAMYLLAKAQQSSKAAEVKALAALEEAAQRLAGAYAEATALEDDVLRGAKVSFDAVSEGYRDGKFDYLQVLDAQRTLFETRSRYVESLTAYHMAKADIERLIGQDLDSINKTHEDHMKESK